MNKETVQLGISVFLIVAGVAMLVSGITIPPIGVIDNSILIAFGEILTFVGSLFGIDHHYRFKSKGDGNGKV